MIFRKNNLSIQNAITRYPALKKQALFGALALLAVVGLVGCGQQASPEEKIRDSLPLAKVNDVEITAQQPANDVALADSRSSATKEAVKKQALEIMIDRQLLQEEAKRYALDRDPEVIQAIDRAKTKILADSYLQSKFTDLDTPSKSKVDAYFKAHPELFTQRKVFYMNELVVATKDFSAQLKARLDSAKSIEQVATWLDTNHVPYKRTKLSRSTADLAPEMITKLQAMRKNQLFVIKADEYSMLSSVYDVKLSPVSAKVAAPQIAQYLRNKKRQEIGDAELERLRASAKIEYLNKKQLAAAISPAKVEIASPTVPTEANMTSAK
ncbi:MAG: EpsD family peptidyl-prolyl cis-trans isomerase [Burkholderiaceae bacterium]